MNTVLAVHSVSGAWHVFRDHPVVLLLMPVIGGFIGWITKVLAIWMVFNPIEYKGIGPIGWQGQLPKRAAKFGSHASELILENLIDPRALIDQLDPKQMMIELDEVIVGAVDDVARDVLGDRWDRVPQAARNAVMARARARAPVVAEHLLEQAKANIDELFDLSYIVTANLIRDKELLNELVRDTIVPEMQFMKRFGALFGAGVGAAQMVVFAFTENHLLIPLCGLGVGLVSDWFALQMIFAPRTPKRYFGLITWHGLFFKRREEFAAQYAKLGAEKVLTPTVVMESLLDGPLADRLFGMIRHEIYEAIDAELGFIEPLVPAAIGSARYQSLRDTVVAHAQKLIPEAAPRVEAYATSVIDIEKTARESLAAMNDEEYEGMLRPVFKDDEWLVVAVGGGLGFFVGEFQVFLLEKLGGL